MSEQPDNFTPGDDEIDDSSAFPTEDIDAMTQDDVQDLTERINIIESDLELAGQDPLEGTIFPAIVATDGSWGEATVLAGNVVLAGSTSSNDWRHFNISDTSSRANLILPVAGLRLLSEIEDLGTSGNFSRYVMLGDLPRFGRITAVNTTTNATTWIYTVTWQDSTTANGYNGFEWNGTNPSMIQGSPGSLGINVGSSGTVTGTSCVVKPIGVTGWMLFAYDTVNAHWTFAAPNSAG